MGYYTSFDLSVSQVPSYEADNIIRDFRDSNEGAEYALDESGDAMESVKWYEHEAELLKFSKKYPQALFELKGEGEENDDLWKLYVQDGKAQLVKARIVYEAFDKKKMR